MTKHRADCKCDRCILQWFYDRLVNVHKENPNYDYMQRLEKIIKSTKAVTHR